MKSWHLIVDVARCHDCNDCFLADKDEFVDNEFPPYSAAQPWHGHRWMNIKRKERGQYPMVQVAYPLDDSLSYDFFSAECLKNKLMIAIVLGPPPECRLQESVFQQRLQEVFDASSFPSR